jgi:outer membrane protein assembly factor BamB
MSEVGRPRQRPRSEPSPVEGEDELGAERTVVHLPGQPLPVFDRLSPSIFDDIPDPRAVMHAPDDPTFDDEPPPPSQATMMMAAPPQFRGMNALPPPQVPSRQPAGAYPAERPPIGSFAPPRAPMPSYPAPPPPYPGTSVPPGAPAYGQVPPAPAPPLQYGAARHPGSVPPPRFSLPYVPMRRREEEEAPPRRGRLVALVVLVLAALGAVGAFVVKSRKPAATAKPAVSGSPSASMSGVVGDTAPPLALTDELVPASFVGDLAEDVVTVGSVLAPASEANKRRLIAVDGATFAIAWISAPLPGYDPATNIAVANGRVIVATDARKVVVYNGASGAELYTLETSAKVLSICSKNKSGRDVWIELEKGGGATFDVMFGKLVNSVAVPVGCPTVEARPDSGGVRVNPSFVRAARPLAAMPAGTLPYVEAANGAYEDRKRNAVVGVDALTGAELWTHAIPAAAKGPGLLGIGNRSVFLADVTPAGALALSCVEAETGSERWKLVSPDSNPPGRVYVGRRRAYVVRGAGADVVDLSSGRVLGRIGAP